MAIVPLRRLFVTLLLLYEERFSIACEEEHGKEKDYNIYTQTHSESGDSGRLRRRRRLGPGKGYYIVAYYISIVIG